ncbi:MAG: hypothetical protein ACOC35_09965 [Promethearchaeia archaeon]
MLEAKDFHLKKLKLELEQTYGILKQRKRDVKSDLIEGLRFSKHLLQAVVQVAAYARTWEYLLNLPSGTFPVYGVPYNEDGAVVVTPEVMGHYKNIFTPDQFKEDADWDEYFASYKR